VTSGGSGASTGGGASGWTVTSGSVRPSGPVLPSGAVLPSGSEPASGSPLPPFGSERGVRPPQAASEIVQAKKKSVCRFTLSA
jgi:hypothetical protein